LDVLGDSSVHFHSVIDESFELCSALIFLLISISFLQYIKNPQKELNTKDQAIPS